MKLDFLKRCKPIIKYVIYTDNIAKAIFFFLFVVTYIILRLEKMLIDPSVLLSKLLYTC